MLFPNISATFFLTFFRTFLHPAISQQVSYEKFLLYLTPSQMLRHGNARIYLALRRICAIFSHAIGAPYDATTSENPQSAIDKNEHGTETLPLLRDADDGAQPAPTIPCSASSAAGTHCGSTANSHTRNRYDEVFNIYRCILPSRRDIELIWI